MAKKILIIALAILILLGLGGIYQYRYSPHYYYVKVTNNGQREDGQGDDGTKFVSYRYQLQGADQDGQTKQLNFTSVKEDNTPLKRNAYLKISYTRAKAENGYEAVPQKDVPQKALKVID